MASTTNEQAFLDALKSVGAKEPSPTVPEETSVKTETFESKESPLGGSGVSTAASPTRQNLWRHPDTHPIVLDSLLIQRFGPEWLEWDAGSLRILIPEAFSTPSVSELNIAKLQACRTLHLVDSFWERWEVFIACLMPFNSEFPDFRVMPVPTVAQCLVAADIAARIRDDVTWSDEMKAYFAVVYEHDGIFLPLPPLDFVSLEVPDVIDQDTLAKRWLPVRVTGKAPTDASILDEQLRRLLGANEYLEASRTRLQQQLRLHAS